MHTDQPDSGRPEVGDRLTITIERLASGGDGVSRFHGFTLFIPYSAPGDIAEVEITDVQKNYGRARILKLIESGPDRVATGCPLAGECPGCQFQHLRYDAQLAAKQGFVADALERIGHLHGVEVRPTIGMADPWRYRNKGEFVADIIDGQVTLGYHSDAKGQIVPLPDCPLHHPMTIDILHAVEAVATEYHLPLAQLITRVSPSEDAGLAILVCWEWDDQLPAAAEALQARVPKLAGVLWSRVRGRSVVRRTLAELLTGRDKLQQHLGKWVFTVSAESFFQVNLQQAEQLLLLADDYAGDLSEAMFLDAYCGVGTFLIPLASRALRSMGIEEHPISLQDAEENITRYALHDIHLYEGRVETIVTRLLRRGREVDVGLLDPPRKGAGRVVLETLAKLKTRRIVLVSCDPATLGRDAGDLSSLGYTISHVQPVDMFPQTWHVESIALAQRN